MNYCILGRFKEYNMFDRPSICWPWCTGPVLVLMPGDCRMCIWCSNHGNTQYDPYKANTCLVTCKLTLAKFQDRCPVVLTVCHTLCYTVAYKIATLYIIHVYIQYIILLYD